MHPALSESSSIALFDEWKRYGFFSICGNKNRLSMKKVEARSQD